MEYLFIVISSYGPITAFWPKIICHGKSYKLPPNVRSLHDDPCIMYEQFENIGYCIYFPLDNYTSYINSTGSRNRFFETHLLWIHKNEILSLLKIYERFSKIEKIAL